VIFFAKPQRSIQKLLTRVAQVNSMLLSDSTVAFATFCVAAAVMALSAGPASAAVSLQ
jgi:hypothetical protein